MDAIETSALADVMDQIGLPDQVVAREIRAMTPSSTFHGRAACVRFAPLDGGKSATASPKDDFSAIDALAREGVVIVMQVDGAFAGAVLGGFMTREYARRGAAAVLTNGVIRDVTELGTLGLPCSPPARAPINGAQRLHRAAIDTTVLRGANGNDVVVDAGDMSATPAT